MMGSKVVKIAVLISANIEWQVVKDMFSGVQVESSPLGEWFFRKYDVHGQEEGIIFLHGGWGKIAAAASTQFAIDTWQPELLINLGTCGGFEGKISKGTIVLAEKTLVYDIVEKMGDQDEHIAHYTTELDLTWLAQPYPIPVLQTVLVSGDKDLDEEEIPFLASKFGAVAGDWESGAIAYVARQNGVKCLILRGVSDIVGHTGGEAYESIDVFIEGAKQVMSTLLISLPQWIAHLQF